MRTPLDAGFIDRLTAATGDLATQATVRMESTYPWYRQLSADERAWVSLVAHAGISAFLEWATDSNESPQLTADVFGSAPRELARIVSLEQTVAMVRTTIDVVESAIDALIDEPERSLVREATYGLSASTRPSSMCHPRELPMYHQRVPVPPYGRLQELRITGGLSAIMNSFLAP